MNTTINTAKHINESLKKSYSYEGYLKLIEELLTEGKSTTEGADEMFVHFSELGLQRMQRWNKKFQLTPEQEARIKAYTKKRTWIVITEGWCGDAAHSVPVIHKIASLSEGIDLRIVLREQNLDLMNDFLTNGGKSIPKLIVFNPEDQFVEADWGPRPAPLQEIFLEAKKNGEDFEVYEQKLQAWYNKDKGQTAAVELLELLK